MDPAMPSQRWVYTTKAHQQVRVVRQVRWVHWVR
jgi:hypothetical protein